MNVSSDTAEVLKMLTQLSDTRRSALLTPGNKHSLDALHRVLTGPPPDIHRIFDVDAESTRLRMYHPVANRTVPAILWFHGGGFVGGSIEAHDVLCRTLAKHSGFAVVSAQYRLAPEHRFPKALDDALHAYQYVRSHGLNWGIDIDRLFVGGSSAGGNLAANVAIRATRAEVQGLLLVYPWLDLAMTGESYGQFKDGYFLTRERLRFMREQYLPSTIRPCDTTVSPMYSTQLNSLPRVLLISADCDPLRSDAEHWQQRLRAAGIGVSATCYPGTIHGFFNHLGAVSAAQAALEDAITWLQTQFTADA